MASPPRTIVGRYRVLEEAGRGGMGSVWRCLDERLGREVAVKQVGRLPGESATDQARALREARSSAALSHPNVVSVFDSVIEDDHVWLVMEYVPGRTLAQLVQEEGPLPPERVARIGAQVADGLAAAHERRTVHRDVKPGNILVTEGDRAKISDFGIARTLGDEQHLTQTGMLTGTPSYFAPEIARGADPSPASDVWALGATLFAAVEGSPPYGSDPNALALLARIASEEPAAPQRAGPLTELLSSMLDRDPGARWSMADVARALHDVHAGPVPDADSDDDGLAETRVAAAAPVAAAPAALAAQPEDEPEPAVTDDDDPGERRRRGGLAAVLVALLALLAVAIGAVALMRGEQEQDPAAEETTSASSTPTRDRTSDRPTRSSKAPEETTEATEETSPPPSETATTPQAATTTQPAAFVEGYYGVLPEDTQAGYSMLSPSYRAELSYGEYDGFWSTVEDVSVLGTAAGGRNAVDVTLLYNGAEEEVRRIYLERAGEGWLITGDEVVG